MLRRIRITLAALFYTGITLLLLDFTGTLHAWLGWMAKVQLLPAVLALNVAVIVLLAVLTLVFGRIYCSVICPLGVMQDLVAHLHSWHKKNRYTYSPELRWVRYPVLVLFALAVVAGIGSVVALLDPYGSYGRMVVSMVQPLYLWANNLLASVAERADSYAFYSVDVWLRSLPTLCVAAVSFAVVAVLAWRGGRTYCNTICPVGTLLGILSRFSLMRVYFNVEKCRNCSLCSRNCKASCIDYKNHRVDHSRCVSCGNCIEKCNHGALHYGFLPGLLKKQSAEATTEQPSSRRAFLLSSTLLASGALAQSKQDAHGGLAAIEEKAIPNRLTPLTPPGSMSAQHMAHHCTACQLCVAQCPNDVLRPSANLLTFMQPTMEYERGYCRPECTRCSEVCPTGAIKPITPAEKTAVQIGHAVWVRKNCLVLTDGVACGNCFRHCPTGAIEMVPSNPNDDESPYIPAVNEAACIGCGACEHLCPARPFPAIYVEGHEVHWRAVP